MFGGAKPPGFGQAPTTSTFGFNQPATASPFGQSSFGKPATGFGAAPAFGQQNTSLFGGTTTQQPSSLFNTATAATSFGAPAAQPPQTGFGGFGQPQQNTSLFGPSQVAQQPNNSLFGGAQANTGFGTQVTNKPFGGGYGAAQPISLFGSTATTQQPATGGFFGQQPSTSSGLFGGATQPFGGAPAGANGTAIVKYQAVHGTDTFVKNSQTSNVNIKQLCITSMKEYENKSLEELRLEDYMANRKGPQAGQSSSLFNTAQAPGGIFGQQMPQQQSTGLFGQPADNKNLFSNQNTTLGGFGQQATTGFGATQPNSLFNKSFGAPVTATTASAFGGFNNTAATTTSPFGGAKPFGQATGGIFGQQQAAPATGFGPPPSVGNFFGQTAQQPQQQQQSLFGATDNKTGFGGLGQAGQQQQPNTGFGGFGAPAANQNNSPFNLNKPATSIGFGAPTSQPNQGGFGGFGSFGQPQQQQQAAPGGLFNSSFAPKLNTSGFGSFGTGQPNTLALVGNTGGGLNLGQTNTSFFGQNTQKPGGLSFNPTGQTGGLFGNTSFNSGQSMGGFGGNTMGNVGIGSGIGGLGQTQTTIPVHQQILALTTSPYGDSPLFKDLKATVNENSLKPTNPSAQKTILESSSNQYKVSPNIRSQIKTKPIGGILSKKSLFDGLEEHDSSMEDCFTLKPNPKRLILNKKSLTSNRTPNSPSHGGADQMNSPRHLDTQAINKSIMASSREEFKNSIPDKPPTNFNIGDKENLTGRDSSRESWLNSAALDRVREKNRISDIGGGGQLNNTINEYHGGGGVVNPVTTHNTTKSPISSESGVLLKIHDSDFNVNKPTESYSLNSTLGLLGSKDSSSMNDSLMFNRSSASDVGSVKSSMMMVSDYDPHPTGIVLRRPGYYTIPSLDDLLSYLKEDETCTVPNFTVGRDGYGNVYFDGPIDVAAMNLDEIVFFRNKEVVIYPDDDNKPPEGSGLNRRAQITLDQVWPFDKTIHEPIKDPERLAGMDYEGKLRRVCDKHDTKFIEYRPETGSWVFRVNHFSKYGLNDSDEEDAAPVDPKKPKLSLPPVVGKETRAENNLTMATKFGKQKATAAEMSTAAHIDLMEYHEESHYRGAAAVAANFSGFTKSPTTDLAMEFGVDSHKLQLMKASFFADEDPFDSRSMVSDYPSGRSSPTDQVVPSKRLIRSTKDSDEYSIASNTNEYPATTRFDTISMDSENQPPSDIQRPTIRPKQTPQKQREEPVKRVVIVKPKVAPIKTYGVTVPLGESVFMKMQTKCVSDVGFMVGRKFKVGWGPRNNLIIPNTHRNEQSLTPRECHELSEFSRVFKGRNNDDNSSVVLQQIQISPNHMNDNRSRPTIERHLETELEHAVRETTNFECPAIRSGSGVIGLEQHFEISGEQSTDKLTATVWSLANALWGEREELESQPVDSHATIMCRREAFAKWLEENASNASSLDMSQGGTRNYLTQLLELLTQHRVTEACELAITHDDHNLSLLIAQISGGPAIRQLVQHQLSLWQDVTADKFIVADRLKVFMLIAGIPILESAHGILNIFSELDWLRAMALHVWYLCSPVASITDSLLAYDKLFGPEALCARPPLPVYVDADDIVFAGVPVWDIRYHLLKLYSRKSHPLEPLLNPATYTTDPLDYRLSWLLLGVLESLGYGHTAELSAAQIHTSFALQLESMGLWHWSVFVLLHLRGQSRRELSVQDMLYRYINLTEDPEYLAKERFVRDRLGVPAKWIYWAKAVKAASLRKYHEQARFLVKAKQWTLAHEVVMEHIVPDAIIKDNIRYIEEFLSAFEEPKQIASWSNQGKIIMDYIDINKKFEILKRVPETELEAHWDILKPQLSDLCSRIGQFPCPTAKHRLCQSEIAQKLARLVRGVLLTTDVNPCWIIKIALEKLPLPQEYALQEIRVVLDKHRFVDNTERY